MHTVYLGYSKTLSSEEMIRYFDVDPTHSEGISLFERAFGCEYIEPGSFEVYDPFEYAPDDFAAFLEERLLPFTPGRNWIERIDFGSARSVFYVKTNHISHLSNDDINLVGPIQIEKFDFE